MNGKKKPRYFPNNWKRVKALDEEFIPTPTLDELMEWKVFQWSLPQNVFCLIRETDRKTGKVKEYVYKKPHAAHNRLVQILTNYNEAVVCDHGVVDLYTNADSPSDE